MARGLLLQPKNARVASCFPVSVVAAEHCTSCEKTGRAMESGTLPGKVFKAAEWMFCENCGVHEPTCKTLKQMLFPHGIFPKKRDPNIDPKILKTLMIGTPENGTSMNLIRPGNSSLSLLVLRLCWDNGKENRVVWGVYMGVIWG